MASDKEEPPEVQLNRDILNGIHKFIDSNIRYVKSTVYIVGGAGIILIARSIYLTRVFTRIEDIPNHFFTKQFRLIGRVKEVREDGVLSIQHIPIMRLRTPFVKQVSDTLPVHLACIDVCSPGRCWLVDNVQNKEVWFHLLHRETSNNNPMLFSRIEIPKKFKRNIQVNEELVRLGLCKILPLSSFSEDSVTKLATDKNLLLFLDRLIQLENHASKKGVGMWTDPEIEYRKKRQKKGWDTLKYIIVSPFKGIHWIFKKIFGRKN